MQTRSLINAALGFAIAAAIVCAIFEGAQRPVATSTEDKYIWLEDVSGARSMEWVNSHNDRSMKAFAADPHWQPFVDEAVKLAGNPERLPVPGLRGDEVYNSWRDSGHPRGLLRKTTVTDYLTAAPHWQTVIDFDALGKEEHVNWVPKGETLPVSGR